MQLGRRAAYLRRCVQVLELLEMHETNHSVRRRVFDIHIKPVVGVSYTTFNNMLNEPNPQRQLDEIENELNDL
ncbi:hypothetical protein SDC9_193279 [bioreactor metagenome]|uniref:Uncharacterized protein n=2 Tax=root TaxID=1 RepID=A0A645I5N1_9ZZZZ